MFFKFLLKKRSINVKNIEKMNKKLFKILTSVACGLGIISSIPFTTTSCGCSSSQDDVVPSNVLPYKVYKIQNNVLIGFTDEFLANPTAYDMCDTMEIPARVTSINDNAFINNKYATIIPPFITKLTFAEGSKCSSIGNHTFQRAGLTSIHLSNCTNLQTIGTNAFNSCSALTYVTSPISLKEIDAYAFSDCPLLNSVDFSNATNLSLIEECVFQDCSALSSIDLSNCTKLSSIGELAFSKSGLTSVTFPNSLETIGKGAFGNCSALTSISLPTNLSTITYALFVNCSTLSSVVFPTNLETIESNAFWGCSSLTSVKFPSSLSTIGENVFYDCSKLDIIEWNSWNGNVSLDSASFSGVCPDGGVINIKNPVNGHGSVELLQHLKSYGGLPQTWGAALPESVYNIGDDNGILYGFTEEFLDNPSAYSGCNCMLIPARVTTINTGAFLSVSTQKIPSFIKKLIFEEESKCTSIGINAFHDCSSLTTIDLLNCVNLLSLESQAFGGTSALKSISLPSSLTVIHNGMFARCTSLNYIAWDISDDYQTSVSIDHNTFFNMSSSGKVKSLNPSVTSEELLNWLKLNELPAGWTAA